MKTSAFLYEYKETGIIRVSLKHPNEFDKTLTPEDINHLYTAHEVAEFVRGLQVDPIFKVLKSYGDIADKIEEEAK